MTPKQATPTEVALVLLIGLLVDGGYTVDAIPDGDAGTTLRVTVAPGDVGKVIGKQGRTARSLRTILCAASMKAGHRYTLDIAETRSAVTR